MLLRVGDTIWMREQPIWPVSSKLSKIGQEVSMECRELSEMLTSERLKILRSGKWSPLALFPPKKLQHRNLRHEGLMRSGVPM
jgi:hypothetical protein